MPLFQQQQFHLTQSLGGWHRATGLGLGAHQNEGLLKQRDLGQRGFRNRQGDNGTIQPAVGQFLRQAGGHGLAQLHVDAGI